MTDFVITKSRRLSRSGDKRYVVIANGKVVDDANGVGYKNKQSAFASYIHKNKRKAM